MSDNQQLPQLLNGRWAGIMGNNACEIYFGIIGLADPKFSGEIKLKKKCIKLDKKNEEHQIFKLEQINIFEQFGNGYLSFAFNNTTINAVISRKSLTMRGSHQNKKYVELQNHKHKIILVSDENNHGHGHSVIGQTFDTSPYSGSYYQKQLFFAQKMS